MTFTRKDIYKPNASVKNWFGIHLNTGINLYLAESKFDKRDMILFSVSVYNPLNDKVNQDKGFINVFSKKYNTLAEMKQALIDKANELAD